MSSVCALRAFVLLAIVLVPSGAQAQERRTPLPPGVEDLPIGFAPWERGWSGPEHHALTITPAPVAPVRASAEWDENIGVFCLWDNASLMNELQRTNDVYVITQNASWWTSWLASNSIPATRFHFLNAPTNTWWVRDYGPWFLWDGNQDFGLADTTYNRPRPLDDVIPGAIASTYGVPYYGVDLIHTGGNYYADGCGNVWSTALVYQENPTKTKAQVDQLMHDYLGAARYVTAELNYDIEHFDTFGKLLAPDRLLWASFPQDTTPWAWSEAALKQFRKLQSPYGWPYKITRMPLWSQSSSWTAYVNSLQSNRKIVMPVYGTSHDAEATAVYQQAAPGYEIAGVSAGGTYWGDSVHCRTRNFIRGDALRIYARPHWEASDDPINPYVVAAEVIPPANVTLVRPPTIEWSLSGGAPFATVVMQPTGQPHEWSGAIPAAPHGSVVSYYVSAQDSAGNTKSAPLVAPDALFTIRVAPDTTPPALEHTALHSLKPADWPPQFVCAASDDTGIPALTLEYRINGVAQPSQTLQQDAGTFVFRTTPTAGAQLGDLVSYRIVARDGATPPNTIASPVQGWNWFRLENASPVLVLELDATPDSGAALARWLDDFGLDVETATSWPASLAGYGSLFVCLGMNPTQGALSSAQANELVSFLNAGGSAYLEGGDAWAQSTTASIYRAAFGVASATSGATLAGPLAGNAGGSTSGMSLAYAGERNSSDHLVAAASAHALLAEGAQTKALAYSTGTYRSAAASFQIAGLQDGSAPSHAKYVAGLVCEELGLGVDLVAHVDAANPALITIDVHGEPGKVCAVFASPAPGWQNLGAPGVLQIQRVTSWIVRTQAIPASGRLRFQVTNDPLAPGTERYFQAYVRDTSPAGYHLTNRDRIADTQP